MTEIINPLASDWPADCATRRPLPPFPFLLLPRFWQIETDAGVVQEIATQARSISPHTHTYAHRDLLIQARDARPRAQA